ncbi:hypothetical protein Leryth_027273, partial [Lithospermum erythrorhizon]
PSFSLSNNLQVLTRFSSLNTVSVSFNTRSFPSLKVQAPRFHVACQAKPETVEKVCSIVRKQLALADDAAVTGESKFAALGADSLDTVIYNTFIPGQFLNLKLLEASQINLVHIKFDTSTSQFSYIKGRLDKNIKPELMIGLSCANLCEIKQASTADHKIA